MTQWWKVPWIISQISVSFSTHAAHVCCTHLNLTSTVRRLGCHWKDSYQFVDKWSKLVSEEWFHVDVHQWPCAKASQIGQYLLKSFQCSRDIDRLATPLRCVQHVRDVDINDIWDSTEHYPWNLSSLRSGDKSFQPFYSDRLLNL